VGIKNRTDGNVQVAIDAIRAARQRHLFPSLTRDGVPAIFETRGNANCHLILRGAGDRPNFDAGSVASAVALMEKDGIAANIVIDCSHGNSTKDPRKQGDVIRAVSEQILAGTGAIKGVMLESHLESGRQNPAPAGLKYGVSVTDACLSLDETIPLLDELNEAVCRINKERRAS
ncbi:MAG: 3-deoxy-7-phosphoheptulonate synthase, partial [Pseudomonadales bacterium]|nr:3-deoxy-7-phosphoheptulonate synthase [Pseudomonadales bacterium]